MVLAHDIDVVMRTKDVKVSEDIMFSTILLSEKTMRGLKDNGYLKPSPVQLHGIPLGKCGFDLMIEAKSGTGKTAVFSVIALEKLELEKGIQTIILAPTREIAYQIHDVIRQLGVFYKDLKVEVVIGGMPVQDDIKKFNKNNVHIVVASPGRLKHLIVEKHINVSSVRLVVLDEADKLMETSFRSDIDYIFTLLPKQKQVIVSSATYPEECKEFVNQYVKNAQHVCPDSNCILLGIEQKVTIVPSHANIVIQTKHRFQELQKILSQTQFKQCLIFCNYQVRVGELHKMLTRNKWPAEQLYGQQEQTERLDALKTLQAYKCRILVSTDLAARGIDASNVDLVINFEPAFEWETYLHRIGRAGRYGSYGIAITILSEGNEVKKFKDELREIGIPLNLKMLSTSEPFDLETPNKITESAKDEIETHVNEPQIGQTYEQLWTVLSKSIDQKENNKNYIQSFDDLFDSFKTSQENNIETFTDLIKSFKDNVTIDCDEGYKTLKVNILPVPYSVTKQRMEFEKFKQNLNVDNEITQTDSDEDYRKPIQLRMSENVVKDDYEKALLDAGLPTAFGGSKYYEPKKNHSTLKGKKYHQNAKSKVKPKTHTNHKRYDSSTSSDSESEYFIPHVHESANKNYGYYHENHTASNQHNSLKLDRLHQFDVWYSQLQANSKLIEQFVYLEEMSKL